MLLAFEQFEIEIIVAEHAILSMRHHCCLMVVQRHRQLPFHSRLIDQQLFVRTGAHSILPPK
jgi:hypothetical protein